MLAAPSSLVAPLVKEVVVVLLVVVPQRRALEEGLRCCVLLMNCVKGIDCGLLRGLMGRESIDFSTSVRPFTAILRCGPQDITFLNAFLWVQRRTGLRKEQGLEKLGLVLYELLEQQPMEPLRLD